MVKGHKISSQTKRLLYLFSFYSFKQRLIYGCKYYNKILCIVNESYTSKTCSHCGELNDMEGSEEYHCMTCGFRVDRDVNGSLNILIKNLRLNL